MLIRSLEKEVRRVIPIEPYWDKAALRRGVTGLMAVRTPSATVLNSIDAIASRPALGSLGLGNVFVSVNFFARNHGLWLTAHSCFFRP